MYVRTLEALAIDPPCPIMLRLDIRAALLHAHCFIKSEGGFYKVMLFRENWAPPDLRSYRGAYILVEPNLTGPNTDDIIRTVQLSVLSQDIHIFMSLLVVGMITSTIWFNRNISSVPANFSAW